VAGVSKSQSVTRSLISLCIGCSVLMCVLLLTERCNACDKALTLTIKRFSPSMLLTLPQDTTSSSTSSLKLLVIIICACKRTAAASSERRKGSQLPAMCAVSCMRIERSVTQALKLSQWLVAVAVLHRSTSQRNTAQQHSESHKELVLTSQQQLAAALLLL
jgi:hypothetical protein